MFTWMLSMVSCWIWSAGYTILESGDSLDQRLVGEGRGGTWLLSAGYTTRISRFIRSNVGWWEGRDGILLDLECRIHYTRVRILIRSNVGWWEGSGRMGSGRAGLG